MRKNSLTTLALSAVAIGTFLALFHEQSHADCYLPRVGPPPLRFQRPRPSKPFVLPPLARDDGPTEGSGKSADLTNSAGTAPIASSTQENGFQPMQSLGSPVIPPGESAQILPGVSSTNLATNSTANDLLIVTPQMLLDYFRPLNGRTNMSVAVPVPFMPAIPAPPSSSSATYKSE